jgi:hypothetical protein
MNSSRVGIWYFNSKSHNKIKLTPDISKIPFHHQPAAAGKSIFIHVMVGQTKLSFAFLRVVGF